MGGLVAPISMALTCRVEEPSTASQPDSCTATNRDAFHSPRQRPIEHGLSVRPSGNFVFALPRASSNCVWVRFSALLRSASLRRRAQARRMIPQGPIADKKKPGTRYPHVRASHSAVASTYRLKRVLDHVGRDLWAHFLAGSDRKSIVNA